MLVSEVKPQKTIFFAHSTERKDKSDWEELDKHLYEVSRCASEFAELFGGQEFSKLLGYLHDLGKVKPEFQRRLEGGKRVSHAGEGAKFASEIFDKKIGRILAYCIAGHHAGLANYGGDGGGQKTLDEWLECTKFIDWPYDNNLVAPPKQVPHPIAGGSVDDFAYAFCIRMLFSCLVDADYLETEAFYANIKNQPPRQKWCGSFKTLHEKLSNHLEKISADAKVTDVNALRAEVLQACRATAQKEPGLFTLTVPTGGGKTLSSLAFALDHVIKHGLRRVIYVIPFTSIIEQTADVFREALKDSDAILEHHSAFDWGDERTFEDDLKNLSPEEETLAKLRKASENWDRPIIITTAVQFFESLYSNKTSRCRKLHNLAKSVIILDEAQTLPLKVLRPCLASLKELARGYGTSVVLCTATQPAVRRKDGFTSQEALEIDETREIAPNPFELFKRLNRVQFKRGQTPMSDGELINALGGVDHGLVIVNNRIHALEFYEEMAKRSLKGARHLSTTMTVLHRQSVLREIRDDLKDERPVRLVSTSLIEAGVDISFQKVWRALAGLESIAQAAGRCNRNGELGNEGGLVTIFEPEQKEDRGMPPELKQFTEAARMVLDKYDDPLHPETMRAYFKRLYWQRSDIELDGFKVLPLLTEFIENFDFEFATVGNLFRLIEDVMVPVIIPHRASQAFGAPQKLIDKIQDAYVMGKLARDVQPYTVQIPRSGRQGLLVEGAAIYLNEKQFGQQFVILENHDLYTDGRGLDWRKPTFRHVHSGY